MPPMPEGDHVRDGILKGMYRFNSTESGNGQQHRPQLFGSGTILNEVLRAQKILKEKFDIGTDVWSVTSYSELARACMDANRWNLLHPDQEPKKSYLMEQLDGIHGPFIASSDNVRLVP